MRIGFLFLFCVAKSFSFEFWCDSSLSQNASALLITAKSVSCLEWNCFFTHYSNLNFTLEKIYAFESDSAEAVECSKLNFEEMEEREEIFLLTDCFFTIGNDSVLADAALLMPQNDCNITQLINPEIVNVTAEEGNKNATQQMIIQKCHQYSAGITVIFLLVTVAGLAVTVNRVKMICYVRKIPVVLHSCVMYRSINTDEFDRTQSVELDESAIPIPEHHCAESIVKFSPFTPVRKRLLSEAARERISEKSQFDQSGAKSNLLR